MPGRKRVTTLSNLEPDWHAQEQIQLLYFFFKHFFTRLFTFSGLKKKKKSPFMVFYGICNNTQFSCVVVATFYNAVQAWICKAFISTIFTLLLFCAHVKGEVTTISSSLHHFPWLNMLVFFFKTKLPQNTEVNTGHRNKLWGNVLPFIPIFILLFSSQSYGFSFLRSTRFYLCF